MNFQEVCEFLGENGYEVVKQNQLTQLTYQKAMQLVITLDLAAFAAAQEGRLEYATFTTKQASSFTGEIFNNIIDCADILNEGRVHLKFPKNNEEAEITLLIMARLANPQPLG